MCFAGDICLIFFFNRKSPLPLAWLSFSLDTFYTFWRFSPPALPSAFWISLAVMSVIFFVFTRLRPHLGSMMGPVIAYIAIISVMVVNSFSSTARQDFSPAGPVSVMAGRFHVSDLLVARHRFPAKTSSTVMRVCQCIMLQCVHAGLFSGNISAKDLTKAEIRYHHTARRRISRHKPDLSFILRYSLRFRKRTCPGGGSKSDRLGKRWIRSKKDRAATWSLPHDITRPIPYSTARTAGGNRISGINRKSITILIATGMHRPSTAEERLFMFAQAANKSYAIVDHDAQGEMDILSGKSHSEPR